MRMWKILLADDDAEDRDILLDAFSDLGAANMVHFAENGEEALKKMHDSYDENDMVSLVVLDLNMPKLNGTETLRLIKEDHRLKNIPVIILSTSVNAYEKEKCMKLGAHSYVIKPIFHRECVEIARDFLRFCQTSSV